MMRKHGELGNAQFRGGGYHVDMVLLQHVHEANKILGIQPRDLIRYPRHVDRLALAHGVEQRRQQGNQNQRCQAI